MCRREESGQSLYSITKRECMAYPHMYFHIETKYKHKPWPTSLNLLLSIADRFKQQQQTFTLGMTGKMMDKQQESR